MKYGKDASGPRAETGAIGTSADADVNDDGDVRECEIAVIGGGVIGCAIACELAPDHDVCVLERGRIAGEATALAAGLVTMAPSYADAPAVADYATDCFRALDGTGAFTYTERPSVELLPSGKVDAARRRVSRHRDAGIDVTFLDRAETTARYPGLDPSGFDGAVEYRDTGWVDPYTLTTVLAGEAKAKGARFRTGTAVERVVVENGQVVGVEVAGAEAGNERLSARTVVMAAGWRSADLLNGVYELPIRPYRTQCLVLEPGRSMGGLPIGWVPGEHVYFHPEHNGDLLIGGFSLAEDSPWEASGAADEAFRNHVAKLLPEVVRGADEARFVDGWAGIDAATPDTQPVIDRTDVEGLLVASGFHGRGVMSAPVAARAVAALCNGTEAPFSLDLFRADRFESRSRDFEFHSVSA